MIVHLYVIDCNNLKLSLSKLALIKQILYKLFITIN